MATGPTTQIIDTFVPKPFDAYIQNITTEKSRLIQSGIVVVSGKLNEDLAGGGMIFETPSWKDLDNDEPNISNDKAIPYDAAWANDATYQRPPTPKKIESFTGTSIRQNKNQSWSVTDMAEQLSGDDPMGAIQNRVGMYWVRYDQKLFISTWKGVFASNTAGRFAASVKAGDQIAGNLTHDIRGGAHSTATEFSAEAFVDAELTLGDEQNVISVVFVHSVVYNRMQKNNLIDFIPDSTGKVRIPVFLGREVRIDDSMPIPEAGVYESWLFAMGTTMWGNQPPKKPSAMVREEGGGNGGGQDVLYNRIQRIIAPVGFEYTGPMANGGGPSRATLELGGTWQQVAPERKQIRAVRLITRES